MKKRKLSEVLGRRTAEGPIEAGQTRGMSLESIVRKYLANRNGILTLLRIYSNLSLSEMAKELDVTAKELEDIEKSDQIVPFQWVPRLAKILKVDLRTLLAVLGHAPFISEGGESGDLRLPIAAQYSGPELSEQEKVDLEQLVKMILENIKEKQTKRRGVK